MKSLNRNLFRMVALAFVLGGSSLISMACDDDSKVENAAEDVGDAVEDAADEVEDKLD